MRKAAIASVRKTQVLLPYHAEARISSLDQKPDVINGKPQSESAPMMKAQPETYSGACPTVITFKGHIAAAGMISASKPVTVKYVFVRSDGVTGPEQTVTFTKQGAQTVSNTWHIGGPVS